MQNPSTATFLSPTHGSLRRYGTLSTMLLTAPWNIEGCLFQGAVFKGMIRLAMKKIRRETDKTFLGKAARHRSLAIVQAAITMSQNDRRPLAASARPG